MFQNCEVLEEKLRQCSGVLIEKSSENKWILCGNLPQIELAHNCIRDMLFETKEHKPISTSSGQRNPIASVNSSPPHEKKGETSIKMTAEEYAVFMPFIIGENTGASSMNYCEDDQSLHISGTYSFVKYVENQAKNMIVKEMDIEKDMYEMMKPDINILKKEKAQLGVFIEKGRLKVLGMSQTSVEYAVKVLEGKRKEILREKRSTGNSQRANDPTVERKGKSTMAVPRRFLPHMTSKVHGCTEYCLRNNFKVSLQKGDILKIQVDAVCCGQDPFFQSKGYIAKTIISRCKDVEIQLRNAVEKKGNQGFHTGEVFMTKRSANLSKYIIFVVTESPASSKETTQEILFGIKMCFSSIFEFADQHKIRRLAVPLLGTGNGLQNFFKIERDQHHLLLLSL